MAAGKLDVYRPAAVYRRLVHYAMPQWRVFALSVLCMMLFSATDALFVYMIRPLIDKVFVAHDPLVIRWMPLAIVAVFFVRGITGFISSYGIAWVGQSVVSRLRCQVFEHLLMVPVSHHDQARTADLQTKLTYHASQVQDSATTVLTSIVRGGLSAVGLLGYMFYTSWRLTVFALIVAPLVGLSVDWVNRRFRTISQRIQSSVTGISHTAAEAITGRRIVKLYGGERFVLDAFKRLDDYLRRQSVKMTASSAASLNLLEVIAGVAVAVLVFVASTPFMLRTTSAGMFGSFIAAMLQLRQPLSSMTDVSSSLQRGIAAGTDLFRFLDTPIEKDTGTRSLARARGALRFDNVQFAYPGAAKALDGVTLDVPAGKTVAFVGKSGGGKSTLLSLIPRFYDPQGGAVLLDGEDLRDYRLADLRQQIALVDQNVVLFNASIAENIAYGQSEVSRERIEQAARRASAWDFIQKKEQGLDTPLGQDGGTLSGGQRQRIAIARALYKDAPILILDEATSALDTESERAIQSALEELMRGRTTLVIAHRLSTIQNADLIVVMQDGRVAEQGSHAELLARNGAYAALHRLQFREEDEGAGGDALLA